MALYSSGVEYGIHCLVNMLDEQGQPIVMSVREAAKLQGVPYEYLGKIFTKLSKAGLVESIEGRKGGFKLAKSPVDINVLDIVQAIDGEKSIFDCKEIRQRMDIFSDQVPSWACKGMCGIQAVMRKAQIQMEKELAKHNISLLSRQLHSKSHPTFAIEMKEWLGSQRNDVV
ncbi:RrF2 family transcriptional regulator [Vibrio crassostreae]|uniref:RrF2 family transcriptional regulator n=1 Tax=Vibrio crassostreae TaxID=246167 RepID=UPI0010481040|nr:Rrf2 family transcriptional regulator [Vibrio crassostreae]TCO04410.1 BadM/Rrf2 family transcriptional regulator [Vibrio crassostreae]CAK1918728.1 BadM/Rrf2 family transcriptional regulator [Vibrio crassostreae]CAK1922700.1 BadM/Rrf2 family transcriptional regulator [Vibrio crassostreae]CAK1959043.1 BadM/Rrf2 family transcriptional regulator [Vibrio crassostreae]CAK2684595.1 BadM/Rrf2 family transcriptional regulator [Vibrio crassostreae]